MAAMRCDWLGEQPRETFPSPVGSLAIMPGKVLMIYSRSAAEVSSDSLSSEPLLHELITTHLEIEIGHRFVSHHVES